MTKVLLDRNADVNKQPISSPVTPLQRLAEDGDSILLQSVFEQFAYFSDKSNHTDHPEELTALRLAVVKRDLASVNVLLDGGANINALHLTSEWLTNPVESELYGFRTTVLFDAVHQQEEGIANLLLDRGADVDMGDITPLCRAVADSNGRMVSLLIKKGAGLRIPVALKDFLEEGWWYSSYRKAFSQEYLSKDFLGQALVAVANARESGSLAETLTASGADINLLIVNEYLLRLLQRKRDKWLLHNVLQWDGLGGALLDFPLLAAWRNGNEPLLRFLLDRGAKTWGIDRESWLQQAILAKQEATEPVEGSSPKEGCSRQFIPAIYGKLLGSDGFREMLRKDGYSERQIGVFDRLESRIGEYMSQAVYADISE